MKTLPAKNLCILFLTAFIWGTAFVAQSVGMDHIGPFAFNAARSFVGGLALIPVILAFDRLKPPVQRQAEKAFRMRCWAWSKGNSAAVPDDPTASLGSHQEKYQTPSSLRMIWSDSWKNGAL